MPALTKPTTASVSFFPAIYGEKWHAVAVGSRDAVCRPNVICDVLSMPIVVIVGQKHVHPLVCLRCLRKAFHPSQGLRS